MVLPLLQVSVLTDQVEAQGEKIRDLEVCLEGHQLKLNATEEMLQQVRVLILSEQANFVHIRLRRCLSKRCLINPSVVFANINECLSVLLCFFMGESMCFSCITSRHVK